MEEEQLVPARTQRHFKKFKKKGKRFLGNNRDASFFLLSSGTKSKEDLFSTFRAVLNAHCALKGNQN